MFWQEPPLAHGVGVAWHSSMSATRGKSQGHVECLLSLLGMTLAGRDQLSTRSAQRGAGCDSGGIYDSLLMQALESPAERLEVWQVRPSAKLRHQACVQFPSPVVTGVNRSATTAIQSGP